MVEIKELAKGLQGAGKVAEQLDEAMVESYGRYTDLRYERARYLAALARFSEAFPEVRKVSVARAPGRVNLIGEHTDYNGLPVLPMAIERDVVIFFSPRKDQKVNLVNTSHWYPPKMFDISRRIRPYAHGNWGNYAKSAAQALQEVTARSLFGMDACVVGDIPSSSGLSSSSALVVATAIALAGVNGLDINRTDMADLLARGERYVGTEGGGMDQAISLLAERGKALKIEFSPLSVSPVSLPADHSFVVCNSLVAAEKSSSARDAFNCRVVECRLGAAMLLKSIGNDNGSNVGSCLSEMRRLSHQDQVAAVERIPNKPVSLKDVSKAVGAPAHVLRESALKLKTGEVMGEPRDGFEVGRRVRHVLSEGRRVELAAQALESGDAAKFGELMNESHESCAVDYEISTPELDALVRIAREEGALGARLTGAGFGGCVIALVKDGNLADFISAIIARYYHDYLTERQCGAPVSVMALEDAIFPCKPCGGAGIVI